MKTKSPNTMKQLKHSIPWLALLFSALLLASCESKNKDQLDPAAALLLMDQQFTSNNDNGTLIDSADRMWMKCAIGQEWNVDLKNCTGTGSPSTYGARSMSFCDTIDTGCVDLTTWLGNDGPAYNACYGLDFAGFTNWRLPTKYEWGVLLGQIDYDTYLKLFPENPVDKYYWTINQSEKVATGTEAIAISLQKDYFGNQYNQNKKSAALYVKCVRDQK